MGRHSMVEEPTPRPSDGRISTGQQRAVGASTGQQRAIGYSTGQQRAITDTAERRATDYSTGQHRVITTTREHRPVGLSTGHHRAIGKAISRRRIAKWPFVIAALIALVVVGLLAWGWANNVLDNRAEARANGCAEGESTMKVLVAPGVEKAVSAAATKWNDARTVVYAHCVDIDVESVPSDRAFDALSGHAGLDTIGGLPAAWIPEATDWAARLAAARPDLIDSPAQPLAAGYAYICLGGATMDEVSVRAAQVFRDFLMAPAQQAGFAGAGVS